jgi:superfamily II DNA/RNA helicase
MEMVINYDMPVEKDSYVHRIGRTGRAGNGGKALNLVTSDDMYAFYEIEEHAGAMIEEIDLPTDEAVEAGKAEIDVIWADKRAKRKKPEPARVSSHNKGNNRSYNRSSRPEHKTHKPRHNDTRHSDTRNNEKRDRPSREHKPKHIHNERIEKREHPVVHQEPVRRVIEENFIPNRRKVVHPPKVEKKKFSLRRLFRK